MKHSPSASVVFLPVKASLVRLARDWLLGALLLLVSGVSFAEGTGSLYSGSSGIDANATRAWLQWYNTSVGSYAGTPLQNSIEVYGNEGEYITFASSANGIGSGAIKVTKPNGTVVTCSTLPGRITSRAAELAGPKTPPSFPASGSQYTPCYLKVDSATTNTPGIYRVQFIAPAGGARTKNTPTIRWIDNWEANAYATDTAASEIAA